MRKWRGEKPQNVVIIHAKAPGIIKENTK